MKAKLDQEQTIIDYFLGKLSPEEEERFAEKYFVDNELFDQLQHVENELLDVYVRGRLSPEDCAAFEHYLANHPQGKDKVALARGLKRLSASQRDNSALILERQAPLPKWRSLWDSVESQNKVLRWALAAGFAFFVLSIGFLVYQHRQIVKARNEIKELRSIEETLRRKVAEQEAEIAKSKVPQSAPTLPPTEQAQSTPLPQAPEPKTFLPAYLVFNLTMRGSAETTLQLKPNTSFIAVTIVLDDTQTNSLYRITVKSISGATIFPPREISAKAKGSRRVLDFMINEPARLTESKYYLEVVGLTGSQEVPGSIRNLPFKVIRMGF